MKTLAFKTIDALNLYPLFHPATNNRAAVFMLHNFQTGDYVNEHLLSAQTLDSFLGYLASHNYQVLSLRKYVELLQQKARLHKAVVFTVDDGYADFHQVAFPIFKKYGYSATIFVTTDFVDSRLFLWWNQIEYAVSTTRVPKLELPPVVASLPLGTDAERHEAIHTLTELLKRVPNETKLSLLADMVKKLQVDISSQPTGKYTPLTWNQIKEMDKGGIDFHPHTRTHPILTQITRDQKTLELGSCKKRLEAELGRPMDIFCYPNGGPLDFDEETIAVLRELGYKAAVTGMPGFDNSVTDVDLFRLRRFAIPNSLPVFKQIVSGLEAVKDVIRS
jgi:peptidoglycan/xylan/chitin deacetylase (PgdA/CDA1 family)